MIARSVVTRLFRRAGVDYEVCFENWRVLLSVPALNFMAGRMLLVRFE